MRGQGISVIIPAYNAASSIRATVASATSKRIAEVIVVDDGSIDDTASIAQESGALVLRQENAGAAAARRRGLAQAKSELVYFLDADDIVIVRSLVSCADALMSRSDVVAVSARTAYLSQRGSRLELPSWPEEVTIESLLARSQPPGPPASLLWRREAVVESLLSLPAPLNPKYAEDYEMLLRVAALGPVLSIADLLCEYQSSGGKSSLEPFKSIRDAEAIRRYYAAHLGVRIETRTTRQLRARVNFRRAFEARVDGRAGLSFWRTVVGLTLDPKMVLLKLQRDLHKRSET